MSPRKRVPQPRRAAALRVLSQQDRLEAEAVRAQLELLATLRREVLRALGEAAGSHVFQLSQVLAAIDREIQRGKDAAQRLLVGEIHDAWRLGGSMLDEALATLGVSAGLAQLSPRLLTVVLEVTSDQIRSIWSELGSQLKVSVRRASLGAATAELEATLSLDRLAAAIRSSRLFDSASLKTDNAIRMELNRAFSLATQSRMDQGNARLGGTLRKYWLDAGDHRVRDTHREATRRYAPGGEVGPIPVGEPFIVGGANLMTPLDPNGPAKEVINCRCREMPWVEDVQLPSLLGAA
jgi:hypothetical protein